IDEAETLDRLIERRVAVVGETGIDLDRDEAVDSGSRLPGRPEEVAGSLDVLDRKSEEDLLRIALAGGDLLQLRVVPATLGQCLLEDGRVRRDADDGVVVGHPLELTCLEQLARQRVEPDADALFRKLMQA